MKTKRISTKVEKALNLQMTKEAEAAQVYLSLGSWAESNGYPGIADYMYKHAGEERNHMMKILRYINARGGEAKVEALRMPSEHPKTLQGLFEKVVAHEFKNTESIYELVDISHIEKDWSTFNFAQWFVKEQLEEETLVLGLLEKYNLASKSQKEINMYDLDKDLSKASQEADLPREATEG